MYNEKVGRFRVTIVAVEKQLVLHSLRASVACKAHCHITLSFVTSLALPYFSMLSHKRHQFCKEATERKMCILIFSITFLKHLPF